jgi:8-oxo-dGTP pyrophosphatase MutT (NUDIX family)
VKRGSTGGSRSITGVGQLRGSFTYGAGAGDRSACAQTGAKAMLPKVAQQTAIRTTCLSFMGSGDSNSLPSRNVVRLVVLDRRERVLLVQAQDRGNPDFGTVWELPGGGVESGESVAEAAIRELREETGLVIASVPAPVWKRDVIYTYRGVRRLHHESICVVRLEGDPAAFEISGRKGFEVEDLGEVRWWSQGELLASSEQFYPMSLAAVLPHVLAGEQVEEALETWP